MTDEREKADIVDRLRAACTDWDGTTLPPGSEPMDGLHCDVLIEAATEIASLRRELEEARLFERALQIAHGAHDGQTDKTGAPYILHPLRVALMGECADDRIVGLLHDVVEDCEEWSLERLRDHFPPRILVAVDTLTKRDGEKYPAFIDRVKLNPIAARVKMNDLADNMDPTRLSMVPRDVSDRLRRKYAAAIRNLAGEKADG